MTDIEQDKFLEKLFDSHLRMQNEMSQLRSQVETLNKLVTKFFSVTTLIIMILLSSLIYVAIGGDGLKQVTNVPKNLITDIAPWTNDKLRLHNNNQLII